MGRTAREPVAAGVQSSLAAASSGLPRVSRHELERASWSGTGGAIESDAFDTMTRDPAQVVTLGDGRRLAYAQSGDPAGRPVLVCHGFPGSRLFGELLEPPARSAGIRLITPDRPGLGESSPAPHQPIGAWPNDLRVLLDHLELDAVPLLGVSAGGPYALACAAVLGARVSRAALVSSVAPPPVASQGKGVLDGVMGGMRARTQQTILAIARRQIRHDADRFLLRTAARLPHPDRALYEQPATRAVLRADLLEAFRQGSAGAAEDAAAADRPWGFALGDVRVPVAFWYGGLDRQVPARAPHDYAAVFPHAPTKLVADEGHLSVLLGCADEILGWVTGGLGPRDGSQAGRNGRRA